MEMHGEFRIPAPRAEVWAKLNDPETLKNCIPGAETVERVSDTEFVAKVVARVGPVKASFSGKVTLTDLDPPSSYTITFVGANLSVTPATAAITVGGYSGAYDGAAHGAAGTATGVGGADLSSYLDLGSKFSSVPGAWNSATGAKKWHYRHSDRPLSWLGP